MGKKMEVEVEVEVGSGNGVHVKEGMKGRNVEGVGAGGVGGAMRERIVRGRKR